MPEISVIIVNWNGKHFLKECLSSLECQTYRDFETILVDNGSQDGSVDYVRTQFPKVTLLALPDNLGFTGGNIAGYERSTGKLIVLLNNDTEAHPAWLEEIHQGSLAFPEAGSFASKMLYFDRREVIENCGFLLGSAGTTTDLGRDELDGPEWAVVRKVFGGCGGAVAYRREMLRKIGFLDADFFMIYEDVDLSFRAQLFGYECVHLPKAIVYHRYRTTIKTQPAWQVFYSQRNIDFVYLKNMPFGLLFRSLPGRLMYEIGAAIYFVRLGSGSAFFKGKADVLRKLPSLMRKRWVIQRQRSESNLQIRALMQEAGLFSKWKKFLSVWGKPKQRLLPKI